VCSILFPGDPATAARPPDPAQSAFLGDLNLDRVISSIIRGRQEYDLAPLFHTRLQDPDAIAYRHEVFGDLERPDLRRTITLFATRMKRMRQCLALSVKLPYPAEKQVWALYAAQAYATAVTDLVEGLHSARLRSRGFTAVRACLAEYATSDAFTGLAARTRRVIDDLSDLRYCLHIDGTSITVSRCEDEPLDLSAEVRSTFARFREGEVDRQEGQQTQSGGLDHVEAAIVERVVRLYPEVFTSLQQASERQRGFLHDVVETFDREVQFYVAYLDHITPMQRAGLQFCHPQVCDDKQVRAADTFDLALAHAVGGGNVVCNDFSLTDPERILVVTGANQGGKTTFARLFGQLHYLAALGVPVPGRDVRLLRFDRVLTHFPKRERLEDLRGRLEDELMRIRDVMDRATPNSILVLNELFGSAKLQDATKLGATVLDRVEGLECLCVFVTFLDELAAPSRTKVSLVAKVHPDDPSTRTFKVVRQPAEGRAHALAIAEKYQLTYDALRQRING
jgi:DNA mismatch repair protein MutS